MVGVGDLVYVIPPGAESVLRPWEIKRMSKGIIFSRIDENWFRVHVVNKDFTKIQDFPRWMLTKVQVSENT